MHMFCIMLLTIAFQCLKYVRSMNVPDEELAALLNLYESTNGDQWDWQNDGGNYWDFSIPFPCADNWQGVTCSTDPDNLHVIYLQLHEYGLNGTLPSSLSNLTELEVLVLSGNSLTGTIPSTLDSFGQLTQMDLSYNQLSGPIPHDLGNPTQLYVLDLSFNYLTGGIPESVRDCSSLAVLALNDNKLSGVVPDMRGCESLATLTLQDNKLSGSIPGILGRCSALTTVKLYNNALTGSIPHELGNCAQLQILDLHVNSLHGSLPDSLGQCANLTSLIFNSNHLYGAIPASYGQLRQLAILTLTYNVISGTLPASLGNTQLTQLKAYANKLSGTIPASLRHLSRLTSLVLGTNRLTGTIPDIFSGMTQLNFLYLAINDLSGPLPSSLGRCSALQNLGLNLNALTGTIPNSLGNATGALNINMADNMLTGTIPESLSDSGALSHLFLDNNALTGTIPASLGNCALTEVNLGFNRLTGVLPAALFSPPTLLGLSVGSNLLTGTLPSAVFGGAGNAPGLFVGGSNLLSGPIPEPPVSPMGLFALNLSRNMLSGTISEAFVGAFSRASFLYLDHNRLHGTLPQDWSVPARTLSYLFLNSNALRGPIPPSLGQASSLVSLNLSNNQFTGPVPSTFAQLFSVEVLMLQHNRLEGGLEEAFGTGGMGNLTTLQLSGNRFTGALPGALFKAPYLDSVAAVGNCLDGPLPEEAICASASLTALVLDGLHSASACRASVIQGQYLLGTLPSCLLEMTNLTTLHLSGNGLTGSIPAVASVSAALTDMSLSHNLLTGSIPAAFLEKDWTELDLSYNRLIGTLHSAEYAKYTNGTTLYLQHNRLSGVIPASVKRVAQLEILETNLFSCLVDRSDLPAQDPDSGKYTCGSDGVNSALYAWLGLAVVTAAVLAAAGYRQWLPSFVRAELPAAQTRVVHTLTALCEVGMIVAAFCVVVLMPVYAAAGAYYPTFTYKYAWTLSGTFLSGTAAFALEVVFLALLLAVSIICVRRCVATLPSPPTTATPGATAEPAAAQGQPSPALAPRKSWWRFRGIVALFLLSITAVAGVNVAFVFATLRLDGRELTVVQILLAVFKLIFSNLVAPILNRRLSSPRQSLFATHLVLALLNVIVIPCAVVMFVSPVCFYHALTGSGTVTSSYTYTGACTNFIMNALAETPTFSCFQTSEATDQTSYTASFVYSYQCSSTFVTYYAPTFVIMCLISAFLVPAQRLALLWLRGFITPSSILYRVHRQALPVVLRDLHSPEQLERCRQDRHRSQLFDANEVMVNILTYLAILLTFGALFPPLALCCAAAMVSVATAAVLSMRRYVWLAGTLGRQDCLEELQRRCDRLVAPHKLRTALIGILWVSCTFYTLFLFDTLGDEVGFAGAYWVLIVVPLLPLVVAFAVHVARWLLPPAENTGDATAGSPVASSEGAMELKQLSAERVGGAQQESVGGIKTVASPIHEV